MNNTSIKIFCDFDGTISPVDIGNEFYRKFGDRIVCDEIVTKWRNGEISSTECLSGECDTINNLDYEKFDNFLSEFQIDKHFRNFQDICISNHIDLFILSDGIKYYIEKLLSPVSDDLTIFSNEIVIKNDGTAEMNFPFRDNICLKCANCKRNHVINNSADDDISIYIGDGHSDFCPVEYCDIIFAKGHLKKFCEQKKIPFYPFESFSDVIPVLNKILDKKRLKKRNQALLKRRELYLIEA